MNAVLKTVSSRRPKSAEKAIKAAPTKRPFSSKKATLKALLPATGNVPSSTPNSDCSADGDLPTALHFVPSNPLISAIRELHRKRQDLHGAEKRLTLQIKAICRRVCDSDKTEGNRMYAALKVGDDHLKSFHISHLQAFFTAQEFFAAARGEIESQMEERALQLPAVKWMDSVKGFGIGSLAAIVGEAGDLSSYSTHSKLWKRFGLAPFKGKSPAQWRFSKPGLTAEQWQDIGYSPSRRSIVWNVGACLLKAQSARVDKETGEELKPAGKYRLVYDARREYETQRGIIKAAAHARAQRYMEKRFLRDLWRAWREF